MSDAPARLGTSYAGHGYETLYHSETSAASPNLALEAWKNSTLRRSIILNLDLFKDMAWDEVGVAIDGQYAALWFGYPGAASNGAGDTGAGLGVSYDQAVAGLSKTLKISQAGSMVENNKWDGYSPDRKVKLELYGTRKEIGQANMGIRMKLEPNRKLSVQNQLALATLLKNLFPEWTDREAWIASSVAVISLDPSAFKTKLVREIAIELRSDGPGSLRLTIKPQSQQNYVDTF